MLVSDPCGLSFDHGLLNKPPIHYQLTGNNAGRADCERIKHCSAGVEQTSFGCCDWTGLESPVTWEESHKSPIPQLPAIDPFTTRLQLRVHPSNRHHRKRLHMTTTANCFETDALALILSMNDSEQALLALTKVTTTTVGSLDGSKPKGKGLKAKKDKTFNKAGQKSADASKPLPISCPLPEKGTYTALQFMTEIRTAGRRVNQDGMPYTNQGEVRNDTIKAIAGYCGWDPMVSFGAQEAAARFKANREIAGNKRLGGPTVAEARSAARSLAGYQSAVQGAPDHVAVKVANLRAQAVVFTEALIAAHNAGNEPAALIERERLNAIHGDIQALGYSV